MKLSTAFSIALLGMLPAFAHAGNEPFFRTDFPNKPYHRRYHRPIPRPASNQINIVSPRIGQDVSGNAVTATLNLGPRLRSDTLQVRLNGKVVTKKFQRMQCNSQGCQWAAKLTSANGLRIGNNRLRANASGFDKHIETARVRFDYRGGLPGDGENLPKYLPTAVGFSLSFAGHQPWATLTTGTPASLQDNIDQTQNSIPYPNMTLPLPNSADCAGIALQVLVLDRVNPTNQIDYRCVPDSATLKMYLSTLTNNVLAIVGTTDAPNSGETAVPPGLDTSSIGGTDYSKTPAAQYPSHYVIIGVPHAPAGTAYEQYSVVPTPDAPNQYNVFADGILAQDETGNYNFHPGGGSPDLFPVSSPLFTVSPSQDPGGAVVSVGGWKYQPPADSQNGFWLLLLDRTLLQPIDSSGEDNAACPQNTYTPVTGTCGTFYPTGSPDSATAQAAVSALASALVGVNPRNLAVLTTIGQPFQNSSYVTPALAQAFVWLGGSRYTVPKLVDPESTYTMVAPGAVSNRSPFDRKVAVSTNAYSGQLQTGELSGVFARDRSGLYAPLVTAQNGDGEHTVTPDFALYEIAAQHPSDWPLTDSSGHIAAYHYLSQWYLSNFHQETGSHAQDLRWFYDQKLGGLWDHYTAFNCQISACPQYPGDGHGFDQSEFNDALAALYHELAALDQTSAYLDAGGLRDLVSNTGGLSTAIIGAAYNVENGQFGNVANNQVSVNASDWMSLASGVLGITSSIFGGTEYAVVSATIGSLSGVLSTGSSLAPFFGSANGAPPSYENKFDTTIGQLATNALTYSNNLTESYDTALDVIYSDPAKLNAVFQKTSDSDSGWQISDLQLDALASTFSTGVSRAMYLQLLPQFYQLSTYPAQPVSDITKMGNMLQTQCCYPYETITWTCSALHSPPLTPENYGLYPEIGGTMTDIFVIGGTIHNQNQPNVSEDLPSQALLDDLFNTDPGTDVGVRLGFPKDPFFSNNQATGGLLLYRSGPSQGYGQCYKPRCSSNTKADCVGP